MNNKIGKIILLIARVNAILHQVSELRNVKVRNGRKKLLWNHDEAIENLKKSISKDKIISDTRYCYFLLPCYVKLNLMEQYCITRTYQNHLAHKQQNKKNFNSNFLIIMLLNARHLWFVYSSWKHALCQFQNIFYTHT